MTYAPKVLVRTENNSAGQIANEKSQLHGANSHSSLMSSSMRLKKSAYLPILPANIFATDPKRKIPENQRKEWDDFMEQCREEEEKIIKSQSFKEKLRSKQESQKSFNIKGLHHAHKPEYNSLLDKDLIVYYSSDLVKSFLVKNKVVIFV